MTPPDKKDSHALYPTHYTWLIFLSAMDIMMTFIVLYRGGRELNGIAAQIITHFDLPGMVIFKFAIVVFFITVCQLVGRRNLAAGRRLAVASILITAIPVALSFYLLLREMYF